MTQLYARTNAGPTPVDVEAVKLHLKVEYDTEDDFLQLLLNAAIQAAESYSGRELRANTWTLIVDVFESRICIRKSPVASITSVKYTVTTTHDTTVATSVYYLKKGEIASEVLLQDGETWPTDIAEVEAGILITFVTAAYQDADQANLAILRAVAYAFENRGDCDTTNATSWLVKSGADKLLDPFRVARV